MIMGDNLVLQKKNYDSEDYDAIKIAIDKLMSASEEQFEELKKEKWYNRVFDMLTFSKKKDIRIAEQIGDLAQAQQLFLEILLRMSNNDAAISSMLSTSFEDIRKIQGQNIYLLERIKKLEDVALGIKADMNISKLSMREKELLCGCLYFINNQSDDTSMEQKIYANTISEYLGVTIQMDNPLEAIDGLDNHVKKQILLCCLEYIFLYDKSNENYDRFENVIAEFDFGNKTLTELKKQVDLLYKFRGAEGFYSKYNIYSNEVINDSFSYDFETGLMCEEFEGENIVQSDRCMSKEEQAIQYFLQFDFDHARYLLEDGNSISGKGLYLLRYIYNWDLAHWDNIKAYDYLEQGYLQGDVLCSINYARTMCSNEEKSIKIINNNINTLTELCEEGDVFAKYEYILIKEYMDEISEEEVDKRFREIIDCYPIASFVYARRCFEKKDYDIAFSIFNRPIFSNYPEAQFYLGLYYYKGFGDIVEKNIIKANALFEQAFLGNYDCCLHYILTALDLNKSMKKETREKIIRYSKRALQSYYYDENNSFSLHDCYGRYQERWDTREKKYRHDGRIAYFGYLFLLKEYEFKEAADLLCLAAALDDVDALLTIARLKHKGIILGTFIDDCTYEEGELKKALWEFGYDISDAEKILERVEKLHISDIDKEKMNSLKEKISKSKKR